MLHRLAFMVLGTIAAVAGAEAVLRLLPVSTGYHYLPLNDSNPVLRGTPFAPYTYSLGWNFRLATQGRLNNDGFISVHNYSREADGPVLIIGDSYVQAAAVRPDLDLHARLTAQLHPIQVYGLGRAGGSLPDYLAMARWGIERYKPRALVFLIVTGDVKDSLQRKLGGYYFEPAGAGYELRRQERPELGWVSKALNETALFRYLYDNLAFTVNFSLGAPPLVVTTSGDAAAQAGYRAVSLFFLSELARSFPPEKTILMIHRGRRAGSFSYDSDINVLDELAPARGFQLLDLAQTFTDYEARAGKRLDYSPVDTHWNALAHQVVAEQLATRLRSAPVSSPCPHLQTSSVHAACQAR